MPLRWIHASIWLASQPLIGPEPKSEATLLLPYQYTATVCAASITPLLVASITSNGFTTEPATR